MIHYPELLQNINFKLYPMNYRSFNLFYTKNSTTNYKLYLYKILQLIFKCLQGTYKKY